tara:strand:+ start:1549 stop:1860 length:312 start_codon:yes stop_codon:yes gene_type:complete
MEYTWKIYDLKRTIDNGVVTSVTYACEGEYESNFDRKIGELEVVGSTSDEGFVSFDDLTEEIVLGWVSSSIDQPAIELLISSSIHERVQIQSAITEATGTPWS